MECEFCKKIYCNKYTLARHKISCINRSNDINLVCLGCQIVCKNENFFEKHITTCLKYKQIELEDIIAEKDKKIKELEDKIFEIAKQPRNVTKNESKNITNNTINNTIINNMNSIDDLTVEFIREQIEVNLTLDQIFKGQKGLAEFTYKNLIYDKKSNKANLGCSDITRSSFFYIEGGIVVKMKGCDTLVQKLLQAKLHSIAVKKVREQSKKLSNDRELSNLNLYNDGLSSIQKLNTDSTVFFNRLGKLIYSKKIVIPITTEDFNFDL